MCPTDWNLPVPLSGVDVHETNWSGTAALHYAAEQGNHAVVKLLLQKGAGVNVRTNEGMTPLHEASAGGHTEIVFTLLDTGAMQLKTRNGTTPLHSATEGGHDDVVQALLDTGAEVHATTKSGNTPLHLASWDGNGTIVQMLLDKGTDVNVGKVKRRATPLHCAASGTESSYSRLRQSAGSNAVTWLQVATTQWSRC